VRENYKVKKNTYNC